MVGHATDFEVVRFQKLLTAKIAKYAKKNQAQLRL